MRRILEMLRAKRKRARPPVTQETETHLIKYGGTTYAVSFPKQVKPTRYDSEHIQFLTDIKDD